MTGDNGVKGRSIPLHKLGCSELCFSWFLFFLGSLLTPCPSPMINSSLCTLQNWGLAVFSTEILNSLPTGVKGITWYLAQMFQQWAYNVHVVGDVRESYMLAISILNTTLNSHCCAIFNCNTEVHGHGHKLLGGFGGMLPWEFLFKSCVKFLHSGHYCHIFSKLFYDT